MNIICVNPNTDRRNTRFQPGLYRQILLLLIFALLFISPVVARDVTPRIGIVYNQEQWELKQQGSDDLEDYHRAITENGGKVVEFSVTHSEEETEQLLKTIQGMIIPGGDDVNPRLYDEEKDPKLEPVDDQLDELEYKIIRYCIDNRIPLLGICRGEQILNVFLGGLLYQDIPTQFPQLRSDSVKVVHRIRQDGVSQPCYHEITIEKDSLLYKILGETRIKVNSYHHQGVKEPGKDLRIVARSDDGFVEAIEIRNIGQRKQGEKGNNCCIDPQTGELNCNHEKTGEGCDNKCKEETGGYFLLGVQFHPELLRREDPRFNAIFQYFIKESANIIPQQEMEEGGTMKGKK